MAVLYLLTDTIKPHYTDAGKDWRQKEKRVAEDEMIRYHHHHNGHESNQTLGDREGQRSLACCSL